MLPKNIWIAPISYTGVNEGLNSMERRQNFNLSDCIRIWVPKGLIDDQKKQQKKWESQHDKRVF